MKLAFLKSGNASLTSCATSITIIGCYSAIILCIVKLHALSTYVGLQSWGKGNL